LTVLENDGGDNRNIQATVSTQVFLTLVFRLVLQEQDGGADGYALGDALARDAVDAAQHSSNRNDQQRMNRFTDEYILTNGNSQFPVLGPW
jgi:hypothetical protein